MKPENRKQQPDWKNHEDHVASIYRLLGYKVTRDINICGQQTDMLCEKILPGAGKTVLYVECKYSCNTEQNSVSKDTVNAFIANFQANKIVYGLTAGVIVSNVNFSQFAKASAINHHDIFIKTVDELYADVFQIQSYLYSCISNYESENLFEDYIPLNSKRLNESTEESLYSFFYKWINDNSNQQLCLLGDFGAGKSTFMRFIHHECSQKYLLGEFKRMPLFIRLRDYYDVRDGQELIERFFSYELATKITYNTFKKFMRDGRFLLLLDGFDEMGVVSDVDIRKKNYLKISQLFTENSKIIITCRPTYFVSFQELLDVFYFYKSQITFSDNAPTRGDKKHTDKFKDISDTLESSFQGQGNNLVDLIEAVSSSPQKTTIANLQLFDEAQIMDYLCKYKQLISSRSNGQLNENSLFLLIKKIYDLEDLAKRPILLNLIVKTLPLFQKSHDGKYKIFINGDEKAIEDITPSVLYYVYTEGELNREYKKGEIRWEISREERRKIISTIAYHMFKNDSLAVELSVISQIVTSYFSIKDVKIERMSSDIRNCGFLVLDRNDFVRFAHKSFMEYFVALYLADLLINKSDANKVLSRQPLPFEILYFLGDLIATFYPILLKKVNELFTSSLDETVKHNSINLLNFARSPRFIVQNINVTGLYYVKLSVKNLSLENCKLENMLISRCYFNTLNAVASNIKDLSITNSNIKSFTIESISSESLNIKKSDLVITVSNSVLQDFELNFSNINRSTFNNTTFIPVASYGSAISNTRFVNVLFMSKDSNHIKQCDFKNVTFERCIFLYADCNGSFLLNCTFKECIFIRCKLDTPSALNCLDGSRGFFIRKQAKEEVINYPNKPLLWTSERSSQADHRIRKIVHADEKKQRDLRLEFIEKLSWEDVLSMAFSQSHPIKYPTMKEVNDKISETQRKRENLLPSQ